MPYNARFSRSFLKKEKRLPDQVKARVIEAVRQILTDQYRGVQLIGDLKGLWRLRVGKYRIIYEIDLLIISRPRVHSFPSIVEQQSFHNHNRLDSHNI